MEWAHETAAYSKFGSHSVSPPRQNSVPYLPISFLHQRSATLHFPSPHSSLHSSPQHTAMKHPSLSLLVFLSLVVLVPQVKGTRFIVGGNMGWSSGVNYTNWTSGKQFYLGDWLFFVYDRNQMNVLQVNKSDYETCNSDHPLVNWTRGAGRDLIPLNVTKPYYIISGKGFCFGGMKLAINVHNLPPPPAAPSEKSDSSRLYQRSNFLVMPIALAAGALWDSLLLAVW
ncbi:Early nodulin-like protein [Drosera capensis]